MELYGNVDDEGKFGEAKIIFECMNMKVLFNENSPAINNQIIIYSIRLSLLTAVLHPHSHEKFMKEGKRDSKEIIIGI